MRTYWPGPLTLVLPRLDGAPTVSAPGPTLAFRAPGHAVALELLDRLGEPVAHSSANRTGDPPPQDAPGVLVRLDQDIDVVLDAGPAPLGQASTILDLSGAEPRILRQGAIPESNLLPPS